MLGFVWDFSPTNVSDYVAYFGSGTGFIQPLWEHHYLVTELHKAASARLLAGAEQSALVAIADWVAAQPIRYINESAGGEWRILYYQTPAGRSTAIDSLPTWLSSLHGAMATRRRPCPGPGWSEIGRLPAIRQPMRKVVPVPITLRTSGQPLLLRLSAGCRARMPHGPR